MARVPGRRPRARVTLLPESRATRRWPAGSCRRRAGRPRRGSLWGGEGGGEDRTSQQANARAGRRLPCWAAGSSARLS